MKNLTTLTLIIFLTFESYAQADRKFIRQGNDEYEAGKFQQAEVLYRKALEKDTESTTADFNLGNALYRQQQYDAAASRFTDLAKNENDKQKLNRYYYNLGNTFFENRKYSESIQAYKNALRSNPGDMDAKHNLQLALRMLNDQQQQQKQNNQQQNNDKQDNQQKNDAGNQDQQPQDQQNQNQQNNQDSESKPSSSQPQPVKGQISPQDAERILQALENQEKEVMKKVQERKEQVQKVQTDKNW